VPQLHSMRLPALLPAASETRCPLMRSISCGTEAASNPLRPRERSTRGAFFARLATAEDTTQCAGQLFEPSGPSNPLVGLANDLDPALDQSGIIVCPHETQNPSPQAAPGDSEPTLLARLTWKNS